jgi:hypothetical protein
MNETILWSIGSADGRSPDLLDTYKAPDLLGDVVWRVPRAGETLGSQQWPLFHPSESDPEAGYRLHPYSIEFAIEGSPAAAYALRIQYLVIAPRLASLEIDINGLVGRAYLRPSPSRSGEIRLLSGLHTTIYSDGELEVLIPGELLRQGENRLVLTACDDGETIVVDRIEAVRRLDRMANGAGFIYQWLRFCELPHTPERAIVKAEIKPSVIYQASARGELSERCYLYVELGRGVDASVLTLALRGDGRDERAELHLPAAPFGHLRQTFDLFDGAGPAAYALAGSVGGERFEQSGTLLRRRKWNVYLTPHAHTDIGYTHRQWEVAERLCRNIDKALDLIAQDERPPTADQQPIKSEPDSSFVVRPSSFTYHLDSAWALETYLATRGERRKRQLLDAIKAGRIAVASVYVDLLTQYAALEDLIRNGEFTESFLRPHGLRTEFSTVVDVASLTGSLPAILEGSGVKYLVHADNQDRGPFRLNGGLHKISPFYWEGTNGGRVLVWLAKMYCELRKVCGSPPVLSSAERGLELWLDEFETEAYAPDAVLLYGQEADNTDIDPQPAEFVRRWNDTYAYPRLIPCDVSAFFRYVEEHFGDTLKTARGDGGAYWEDGAGSTIAEAIEVRGAQASLPAAERLEALAAAHNPDWAYPAEHFREAWRELLLFDEHTWGAFLSCREPEALLQRDQWAVKRHMAESAAQWAARLLHVAAARHSLSWNNDGREVVVYNPHSWRFGGPATVEIGVRERAFDPNTGAPIPMRVVQTLETQRLAELWVDGVDGLSYRRFVLREVDEPAQAGFVEGSLGLQAPGGQGEGQIALENEHYRLAFDLGRGCVASWLDRALGQELADTRDRWGFGQLLYTRGGEGTRLVSNQADLPEGSPEVLASWEPIEHRLERFEWGQSLRLRGRAPYGELEVEWSLPAGAKRVDVRYTYHKHERREKEAVYVAFPLALPAAQARSDSQLGWVHWDSQELPGGCKEWLPLQTGVLVSGAGADVLIASPDIPLFCVGDIVRGRWPKELDLSGGRIFSYVLNNYWHTNYKASQGGPITFSYQLTSDAAIAKDRAFRLGWQARRPLYPQRMSFQDFREVRAPYTEPAGGALARVGPEQVILSTMKQAAWAAGFVLRLQEIAGSDRIATVGLCGRKIAAAWATDLLERDLGELPVEPDGTLRVAVPAWGLATVRVVLG